MPFDFQGLLADPRLMQGLAIMSGVRRGVPAGETMQRFAQMEDAKRRTALEEKQQGLLDREYERKAKQAEREEARRKRMSDLASNWGLLSPEERKVQYQRMAIESNQPQLLADMFNPSAPTIQTFYEGNYIIQKQWTPNGWVEVSRALNPQLNRQSSAGTTREERAYARYKDLYIKSMTQPLSQEEQLDMQQATSVLEEPKLRVGEEGELVSYKRQAPRFGGPLSQDGSTATASPAGQRAGGFEIETVRERTGGSAKTKIETAFGRIGRITNELIPEGSARGEPMGGIAGTLYAYGASPARQLGLTDKVPVAEELKATFDLLNSVVAPAIMDEKRLAVPEREYVNRAIGGLTWENDVPRMIIKLREVVDILNPIYAKLGGNKVFRLNENGILEVGTRTK